MILILIFIGLATWWWFQATKKPDKFPPGPIRLPVVGGAPFVMVKDSLIHSFRYMVDKYGPITGVYFGSHPAVIITDYEIVKDLLKREDTSFRPKMIPANTLRPGWEDFHGDNEGQIPGVIFSSGTYWREQRRFLLKNLRDFGFGKNSMESILQDEVSKLCTKLSKIPQDEPTDLSRTLNISILNALWNMLVGETLDLEDEKTSKLIKMFDTFLRESSSLISPIINLLPNPMWATLPILKKIFGFDRAKEVSDLSFEFIKSYIDSHKKTFDAHNIRDFTDLMLLEIKNTTNPESSFFGKTGENALVCNLLDLFMAGMETTSTSLLWTFLFLLHHPDKQRRVHEELDAIVGKDRLPSLDDRPQLHYTNAVLLESFRASALVSTGVPHRATADINVGEYIIPKGTSIFGSLYHIMHDPEHFKNPHKFEPERFLNSQGEFKSDDRVIPFGTGKRVCLGQTLAEKEFYIFFTGFMQQFELRHAPGTNLPAYGIDSTNPKDVIRSAPLFQVNLIHR